MVYGWCSQCGPKLLRDWDRKILFVLKSYLNFHLFVLDMGSMHWGKSNLPPKNCGMKKVKPLAISDAKEKKQGENKASKAFTCEGTSYRGHIFFISEAWRIPTIPQKNAQNSNSDYMLFLRSQSPWATDVVLYISCAQRLILIQRVVALSTKISRCGRLTIT